MKARKFVTAEALLELLNDRLATYGQCHACRFAGPIRPLRTPEEDGRNWSVHIPFVCSNRLSGGCKRLAHRIIAEAAVDYNITGQTEVRSPLSGRPGRDPD